MKEKKTKLSCKLNEKLILGNLRKLDHSKNKIYGIIGISENKIRKNSATNSKFKNLKWRQLSQKT